MFVTEEVEPATKAVPENVVYTRPMPPPSTSGAAPLKVCGGDAFHRQRRERHAESYT
jgi:hypothetical protein